MAHNNLKAIHCFPEEVNAFEAKQALASGEERPVGWYCSDVALALRLIADHWFDATAAGLCKSMREEESGDNPPTDREEWEGDLIQLREALDRRQPQLIGSFLRDVADFHDHLALAFDGGEDRKGWHLKMVRKGPGRMTDRMARTLNDSRISMALKLATFRTKKQDSALAEVEAKLGISRATIMRAKQRHDGRRNLRKKK